MGPGCSCRGHDSFVELRGLSAARMYVKGGVLATLGHPSVVFGVNDFGERARRQRLSSEGRRRSIARLGLITAELSDPARQGVWDAVEKRFGGIERGRGAEHLGVDVPCEWLLGESLYEYGWLRRHREGRVARRMVDVASRMSASVRGDDPEEGQQQQQHRGRVCDSPMRGVREIRGERWSLIGREGYRPRLMGPAGAKAGSL